jgi:hypothetical protein
MSRAAGYHIVATLAFNRDRATVIEASQKPPIEPEAANGSGARTGYVAKYMLRSATSPSHAHAHYSVLYSRSSTFLDSASRS